VSRGAEWWRGRSIRGAPVRASALSAGDRHDGGVIKKVRQVFKSSAIVKLKFAHHANTMGAEAVIEPGFWSKGEHIVHEDRRTKGGDTGTGRVTVHGLD
jgi:hypothetical protein